MLQVELILLTFGLVFGGVYSLGSVLLNRSFEQHVVPHSTRALAGLRHRAAAGFQTRDF
jgi:hypothetical protein